MAKVITLLQPWAQLVVTGQKQFETRGWKTGYRGELFIHSSGRMCAGDSELCEIDPDFKACIPDLSQLKMGFIIGKVTLVKIIPTDNTVAMQYIAERLGNIAARRELRFGDYRPKRYAWEFANPILFVNPIWARGALNIWDYKQSDIEDLSPVGAYPGDSSPMMGQSY